MSDLPAYTGPDQPCPGCGLGLVLTEWHWAARHAAQEIAGHRPPCAGRTDLLRPGGRGEHLCRLCLNCGYGWLEACAGQGTVPPPVTPAAAARLVPLPPAVCAGLAALAGALASTGADAFAGLMLRGASLAVMQIAAAVVIAVMTTVGYAVFTACGTADAGVRFTHKELVVSASTGTRTGRGQVLRVLAGPRKHFRRLFPAVPRASRGVRS